MTRWTVSLRGRLACERNSRTGSVWSGSVVARRLEERRLGDGNAVWMAVAGCLGIDCSGWTA